MDSNPYTAPQAIPSDETQIGHGWMARLLLAFEHVAFYLVIGFIIAASATVPLMVISWLLWSDL
jgi:hypothetical protein